MANAKFEATDRSVSDAYELRQLVGIIFSYANYGSDDLRKVCVRLHNAGTINLTGIVHTKEFESTNLQEFFAGQQFYCEVLPKLEAPVGEMISCIELHPVLLTPA